MLQRPQHRLPALRAPSVALLLATTLASVAAQFYLSPPPPPPPPPGFRVPAAPYYCNTYLNGNVPGGCPNCLSGSSCAVSARGR